MGPGCGDPSRPFAVTNPHADHIGGLAKVVSDFKPTTVVYSSEETRATWRGLKSRPTLATRRARSAARS
jgi:beta-lactamase superfamily II metal-dependent hydrolase